MEGGQDQAVSIILTPWSGLGASLELGRGPRRSHHSHRSLDLSGEDDLEALKAKNIKQTELVADLREAILRVARHFQCIDPKNCNVVSRGLPVLCPVG